MIHEYTGKEVVLAEIIINEKPFAEIAAYYEKLAVEKGGEEYTGFGYIYNFAEYLYDELISKTGIASANEPSLMICDGCYEDGCWAILVTIDETDNEVIWRGLHNHHRSKQGQDRKYWDYSVFPEYHFEKTAYQAALEQLKAISKE